MALEKIGRYEIVGQLGKGAMGVVYRAMDPTIGRTVALKTMRLDVQGPDSSEMLARFRNEARLAGVLNHPNIVTIYDAGEINGLFYMAMEYIEGKTLYQLMLQEHALPMETVLDLSRQICAGLDAASTQRVVHRDIKPANIMILPSGTVKITDFGIAKAGGSMTSTGEVLGTPNYMSPEQVKGKPLDGRSDLFSFGVILYEMITGEKPFAGDNITTIIYKIVNEDPIPPRELNPEVHPGLNRVILKALAKTPQERYQMGADLLQALENYENLPEEEEPPKPIPAGVFEFPQQSTFPSTVKTPAPVRTPNGVPTPARTATGKATAARGVVSKVPGKKPMIAQRSIPLMPVVAGVLAVIIVVVTSVIIYIKHEQTKQKEEMARVLQQNTGTAATEPPATSQPVSVATPATSSTPPPDASQNPPVESSSEPGPWRSNRRHTSSIATGHTSAVTTPTSARLGSGQLVLSSDPDGADVKIDGAGQPDWRTPFTATAVPPGPHTITFSKNGYSIETRVAEVNAGKPAYVNAKLKVGTATASINSDPPGAAILIDEREIAKTTPTQIVLGRGMHNITVRKSGFQVATTNVDLQEGQQFSFAPTLKPLELEKAKESHGNIFSRMFGGNAGDRIGVEVHTVPRGAQISVNGELYSKTTPTKLALPPGEYEIILQLPGYRPLRKNLTVEKGPAIRIEETLQK
jgi:serine/threonine protein kinase